MFKVFFRNAKTGYDLTGAVYLPAIPAVGESVDIKEREHHGRSQTGRVTARHWFILTKDTEGSHAVVSVALD